MTAKSTKVPSAEDYKKMKWPERKRPPGNRYEEVDWEGRFRAERERLLKDEQFRSLLAGAEQHQFEWDRYLILGDFCLDEEAPLMALALKWMGEHLATPLWDERWKKWVWNTDYERRNNVHNLRVLKSSIWVEGSPTFAGAVANLGVELAKLRQNLCVSGDIEYAVKTVKKEKAGRKSG